MMESSAKELTILQDAVSNGGDAGCIARTLQGICVIISEAFYRDLTDVGYKSPDIEKTWMRDLDLEHTKHHLRGEGRS